MESRILSAGFIVLVVILLLGVFRAHFSEPTYHPAPTQTADAPASPEQPQTTSRVGG